MTSNIRNTLLIGAMFSCSLAGFACDKTPAEAHTDAVEAQQKADDKSAEAKQEGADKVVEAKQEAAAATDDARQKTAEAQATANEKIRDSNTKMAAAGQSDARTWGQKEIDSVDNMIDQASTKVQTAPAKKKDHFNQAMLDVKKQREGLHTDLAALDVPAGDKLDKNKAEFTQRVDRIKLSLKNIDKAM